MKLRNINPIGLVDVPLLYRQGEPFDTEGVGCLQPGEVFDVTEDQARQLLGQPTNYEPADDEATALLDQLAAEALEQAHAALAEAEAAQQPVTAPPGTGEPTTPATGPASGDGAGTAGPPAATSNEGTA